MFLVLDEIQNSFQCAWEGRSNLIATTHFLRTYTKGQKVEQKKRRLAKYLLKKYGKTSLTKSEAHKELLHPIKGNKMSIDEVAERVVEDYRLGIFF